MNLEVRRVDFLLGTLRDRLCIARDDRSGAKDEDDRSFTHPELIFLIADKYLAYRHPYVAQPQSPKQRSSLPQFHKQSDSVGPLPKHFAAQQDYQSALFLVIRF